MYECKRSHEIIVCHKHWSILWLIVQDCSRTIKYQVSQHVPCVSISEQFESIHVTMHPQISILLLWSDGHRYMESILCGVVESSCLPTHNIVPHISWHALPYRRTTKKYEKFPSMVVFQFHPRKFVIQTWLCNCPQYLCFFSHCLWVHSKYTWSRKDATSLLSTFHIGSMFCFFPANLMSSTYTDKNNPFSQCTSKHSQSETFSQPYFNRIFLKLPFPLQSCQGMTVQIPLKRNDRMFHTGPWFRPFVSW